MVELEVVEGQTFKPGLNVTFARQPISVRVYCSVAKCARGARERACYQNIVTWHGGMASWRVYILHDIFCQHEG